MQNNDDKYYLVLECRPGDFMPIDINIINSLPYRIDYSILENIDNFTKNYFDFEIRNMIRLNNLVPFEYMDGKLQIMNQNHYRFPLYTKDCIFSIVDFFDNFHSDKQIMNKFMNIYLKYQKDQKLFEVMKLAIEKGNTIQILSLLYNLPYVKMRSIYMYISQNILNDEKKRVLENNYVA